MSRIADSRDAGSYDAVMVGTAEIEAGVPASSGILRKVLVVL